jgi:hypothetical protein
MKSSPAGVGKTARASHPCRAFSLASPLEKKQVFEKREEVDWRRHMVFCTFGICYLGGFQYWLYNIQVRVERGGEEAREEFQGISRLGARTFLVLLNLSNPKKSLFLHTQFTRLCAPITAKFGHKGVAPLKVLLDQGLHHPFIYFPVFYSMKAFVEGKPMTTAWDKYRTEIRDSCQALWKIWVPAQAINFAFVPRHMRIPFVAAVSFGWTVVLSVMQGKFDAARLEAASEGGGGGGGGAPSTSSSSRGEGGGGVGLVGGVKGGGGGRIPVTASPGGDGSAPAAPVVVAAAAAAPPAGLKDLAGGGRGGGSPGRIVAASHAESGAFAAALATAAAERA